MAWITKALGSTLENIQEHTLDVIILYKKQPLHNELRKLAKLFNRKTKIDDTKQQLTTTTTTTQNTKQNSKSWEYNLNTLNWNKINEETHKSTGQDDRKQQNIHYKEGQVVNAQWDDDNYYDATIDAITKYGFQVRYIYYNEIQTLPRTRLQPINTRKTIEDKKKRRRYYN